jgi:hypothetical protein
MRMVGGNERFSAAYVLTVFDIGGRASNITCGFTTYWVPTTRIFLRSSRIGTTKLIRYMYDHGKKVSRYPGVNSVAQRLLTFLPWLYILRWENAPSLSNGANTPHIATRRMVFGMYGNVEHIMCS